MRCLALITGGLDAQIAVRMLQRQGLEVVGFHVSTPFTAPVGSVQQAADELQIELIVDDWHDYLSIVRRPKFGYAAEMAPCIDCRIGMLQRASAKRVEIGAAFIISGEVVGQRPSSLRSRDLETMAIHGGVDDLLLRPLSAKLLPSTLPERNGWVNRELLHGWHGKGRREQLRVAGEWNLHEANGHAPGCLLLQEMFASRLKRLLNARRTLSNAELASLSFGRHYSLGESSHLVVARQAAEGANLQQLWSSQPDDSQLIEPANFRGPRALAFGKLEPADRVAIAFLIAAAGKDVVPGASAVSFASQGEILSELVAPVQPDDKWPDPWH